jgi:hypothetical protein
MPECNFVESKIWMPDKVVLRTLDSDSRGLDVLNR